MKVEVGQWARDDNCIFEITKEITCIFINLDIKSEINNVKVADTPQELIEVGDLVGIKNDNVLLITRLHHSCKVIKSYNNSISYNNITKILTPNGKDYIFQWEAK